MGKRGPPSLSPTTKKRKQGERRHRHALKGILGSQYNRWHKLRQDRSDEDFAKVLMDGYDRFQLQAGPFVPLAAISPARTALLSTPIPTCGLTSTPSGPHVSLPDVDYTKISSVSPKVSEVHPQTDIIPRELTWRASSDKHLEISFIYPSDHESICDAGEGLQSADESEELQGDSIINLASSNVRGSMEIITQYRGLEGKENESKTFKPFCQEARMSNIHADESTLVEIESNNAISNPTYSCKTVSSIADHRYAKAPDAEFKKVMKSTPCNYPAADENVPGGKGNVVDPDNEAIQIYEDIGDENESDSDTSLLELMLRDEQEEPTTKWIHRRPRQASSKVQKFIRSSIIDTESCDAEPEEDEWKPQDKAKKCDDDDCDDSDGDYDDSNDDDDDHSDDDDDDTVVSPENAARRRFNPLVVRARSYDPKKLRKDAAAPALVDSCQRCHSLLLRADVAKHEQDCGSSNNSSSINKELMCEYCAKMFPTPVALGKHIRRIHVGESVKCDDCGMVLSCYQGMLSHRRRRHGDGMRIHSCTTCGRAFDNLHHLTRHSNVHLAVRPRDYPCTYAGCQRAFYDTKHLKVHMLRHTGEKPLQCDRCEFVCRQRNSMNYHINKYHREDEPTPSLAGDALN
ncbi:PREDICTED: uncharacterized protein LOC106805493 [Priapulus caudatus]|uniref:Uncharacterized protein LOC106805493 n=1 Tax=Priapulus caudatus TaxID=37621 RepID=A0ABM1DRM2_PRICU|nr:PREDICTED: uncharacterized protein LOC106805493 [Priapulus caudatus]